MISRVNCYEVSINSWKVGRHALSVCIQFLNRISRYVPINKCENVNSSWRGSTGSEAAVDPLIERSDDLAKRRAVLKISLKKPVPYGGFRKVIDENCSNFIEGCHDNSRGAEIPVIVEM